jgi:hypothetical protein
VVAALAAMLVLRSSWFIAGRVEGVLSQQFGGQVTVAHARYMGDGRFRVRGVRLRAPGVAGDPGEVAAISEAMIEMDEAALARLEPVPRRIEVERITLRLAEDAESPGSFAFQTLRPQWSSESEAAAPEIEIKRLEIQVGTYAGTRFDRRTARDFRASMERAAGTAGDDGWYDVRLNETDDARYGADGFIGLNGRLNARTLENQFSMKALRLRPETIDLAPLAARSILREMELDGQVRAVTVGWSPAGFAFGFEADDVSFVLPVEIGVAWSRYRAGTLEEVGTRPRLRVDAGRFAFAGNQLTLSDLRGNIESSTGDADVAGVPYEIDFTIGDPNGARLGPSGAAIWTRENLATAAFSLSFTSRGLRVGQAADPDGGDDRTGEAIDVPRPVASVLEAFAFERFVLDTELDVRRGGPVAGPAGTVPGPVVTAGRARITEAAGRYQPFPYRLDAVTAELEFDEQEVRIIGVQGTGSGGAPLRLAGVVREFGDYPEVALTLEAEGLAVDERFREAFTGEIGSVIDRLRHVPSRERLAAAGIPDAGAGGGAGGAGPDEAFGGTVDLRLHIDRTPGPGDNTRVHGRIDLHEVDLVLDRFPYPMRVVSGAVMLDRGRLDVVSEPGADRGLEIRTAGGGTGSLSGGVSWRGDDPVQLQLRLAIEGDRVSRALLAAIPPSDAEREDDPERWAAWPGGVLARGGAWLSRLQLDGRLDYTARLRPASDGELDYEIGVELADASADAGAAIRVATDRAPGTPLAGDWGLRDVNGRVVITPQGLQLEAIAGTTDDGRLELGGRIGLDGEARVVDLEIDATGLSVDEHLQDVLPPDRRVRLEPILTAHRPRGIVDASLQVHSDGYGDASVDGVIRPRRLELDLDGVPMQFDAAGGDIGLQFGDGGTTALSFRGLDLRFTDPADPASDEDQTRDRRRGTMLDGRVVFGAAGTPEVELDATWTMARLRSPLMRQILQWVGGEAQLARLDELEAAGDLDLTVHYERIPATRGDSGGDGGGDGGGEDAAGASAAPDATDWRLSIRPRTVAVRVHDVPIAVRLDPGAELLIRPGSIELVDVTGRNDQLRASVQGRVLTGDGIDATLSMDLDGQLLGRQVSALLPAAVRSVLEQLELTETRPTRVRDILVRYRVREQDLAAASDGEAAAARRPFISFNGTVELDDAALRAGLALGSISGPFDITYAMGPGRATDLVVSARPSTLRLAGQTLTALEATIRMDADGSTIRLEELRGRAGAGTLVATASFSTEPDGPWEAWMNVAAVPLADFEFARETDENAAIAAAVPADDASPEDPAENPDDPVVRSLSGEVFGRFQLSGRRNDPASMVGRGRVLVRNADMFAIPPVLGLLQAMQLTFPATNYDHAQAKFFVAGRRVYFDELYLESSFAEQNGHALIARGSFDLDTQQIDGRVRSRSGLFLPLREMVGAFGDAMAAIELEGTLFEPRVRLELLAGDRAESQAVQARPRRPAPRIGAATDDPPPGE